MPCELIEHKIDSHHALTLTDGEVSLTLLPEKGGDIVSLRQEKTDTEYLWTTHYAGGWQECFPIGGPPINYRGAAIGQHGEVRNLAWKVVEKNVSENEVFVVLSVRTGKTPFLVVKKITLRRGTGLFEFEESVSNEGEEDLPIIWGQHPALGGNFLSGDCKIDAPAKKIWSYVLPENATTGQFEQNIFGTWPYLQNKKGALVDVSEISPPTAHTADMLFIGEFEEGWFAITNREQKVGLAFLFDHKLFPVVWYWQMFGGGTGYPWYGRAYTCALEPFTGVPNPAAPDIDHVAGTLIVGAHETVSTRFRVLLYKNIKGVGRITPEGVIVPRI